MLYTQLYFLSCPIFCNCTIILSYNRIYLILSHLNLLILGIAVSVLSSFASNLWNHTNDLREDNAQGRKTVLTEKLISHRTAMVVSIFLYGVSIIITLFASIKFEKPIYIFFLIWAAVTWFYSDNIF